MATSEHLGCSDVRRRGKWDGMVGRERHEQKRPPVVLLGEDDYELRTLMEWVLSQRGYAVITVTSSDQIIDYLQSSATDPERYQPVDLIISDLGPTGRSGLQVLRLLRQTDWNTPVILISPAADVRVRDEAYRLGAMLLNRPFDLLDLRLHVETLAPPPPM